MASLIVPSGGIILKMKKWNYLSAKLAVTSVSVPLSYMCFLVGADFAIYLIEK